MGRGFQTLTPERQREIARLGGQAAHHKGVAHTWTREEAIAAGRKGAAALLTKDPEQMSRMGRVGGRASAEARRRKREGQANG